MQPLLTVEVWVNTSAESLGTNSKVYHFTKSAILQTSIQEQKGPSLVKLSKFLISEVPSLWKTSPVKKPDAKHGVLIKNIDNREREPNSFGHSTRHTCWWPSVWNLWSVHVQLQSMRRKPTIRPRREARDTNFMKGSMRGSALNRIIHNSHLQKKDQSGGKKGTESRPFPSRKANCSLDFGLFLDHWSQWFCRELCRPI